MITVDRLISMLQGLDPRAEVLLCVGEEGEKKFAELKGDNKGFKIVVRNKE